MTTDPIILYTQTGCRDSDRVRDYLRTHGIPFTERNVTGNDQAAQELANTGTFATPLLVVGNQQVIGYRPERIRELTQPT